MKLSRFASMVDVAVKGAAAPLNGERKTATVCRDLGEAARLRFMASQRRFMLCGNVKRFIFFYFALPFGVCRALLVVRSVTYLQYAPSLSSLAKPGIHPNGFAKWMWF